MNTDYGFSNNFLNKYDLGGYSTGQFNYASGSYVKKENSNITIITNDGDRVTISSDKSVKSTYSSYASLLHSGTSSAGLEGYEYQSQMQGEFSMSIVGDLDSEEYKDIISALATIDSVMKSVSSGNMVDLQATAEKFGKLDSLSGLSASIQVEETMRYEQVQAEVSEVNKPESTESKGRRHAEQLDHALDRIINSGKKHGKALGKVKQLMNDYLTGLLDTFSIKPGENQHNRQAGELMRDMITNRLAEKSQGEESMVGKTKIDSY